MRAWILVTAALLIPIGLATTALWRVADWAAPSYVQSRPAEVTLVVARPVSAAQVPPTLVPAPGTAAATQVATQSATPMPTTQSASPIPTETPAAVAMPTPGVVASVPKATSVALPTLGAVTPNQLLQAGTQAETLTTNAVPTATPQQSSPQVAVASLLVVSGKPTPQPTAVPDVSTITNSPPAPVVAVARAPAEPRPAPTRIKPPTHAEHPPPAQVKNHGDPKHRD